jgi:hypothetical protein
VFHQPGRDRDLPRHLRPPVRSQHQTGLDQHLGGVEPTTRSTEPEHDPEAAEAQLLQPHARLFRKATDHVPQRPRIGHDLAQPCDQVSLAQPVRLDPQRRQAGTQLVDEHRPGQFHRRPPATHVGGPVLPQNLGQVDDLAVRPGQPDSAQDSHLVTHGLLVGPQQRRGGGHGRRLPEHSHGLTDDQRVPAERVHRGHDGPDTAESLSQLPEPTRHRLTTNVRTRVQQPDQRLFVQSRQVTGERHVTHVSTLCRTHHEGRRAR